MAPFRTVLFPDAMPDAPWPDTAPEHFDDLRLDRIVTAIAARWKDHDLAPFFFLSLTDERAVVYRQEIMSDLDEPETAQALSQFVTRYRRMRQQLKLAETLHHPLERQRHFLNAAEIYVVAVTGLGDDLAAQPIRARGLQGLRDWLHAHVADAPFQSLTADVQEALVALGDVRYTLFLHGNAVTVRGYHGEDSYASEVQALFARFPGEGATDYRTAMVDAGELNHIEWQILDRVARLFPEPFRMLDTFATAHAGYVDPVVERLDREIGFYLATLAFLASMRRAGLAFCYPRMSRERKAIRGRAVFDLALAAQLVTLRTPVVTNDFTLEGSERIFVVTGPNHAGKTTFARTIGQMHYLGALGCPVPGSEAELFLCDRLLVQFEREETMTSQRGKLQDDLVRMRRLLDHATADSVIILNEVFASATLLDALDLSRRILAAITALDAITVCVTFLDELASFSSRVVSLVGSVEAANPDTRTFRLERRPADGLAYAWAVAEKFSVTYDQLTRRLS